MLRDQQLNLVALGAVLVAIVIPVFTSQLKKAQVATDLANVRSAYADAIATEMAEGNFDDDGKIAVTIANPCTNSTVKVSGTTVTVEHKNDSNVSETFTIDPDVTLTIS